MGLARGNSGGVKCDMVWERALDGSRELIGVRARSAGMVTVPLPPRASLLWWHERQLVRGVRLRLSHGTRLIRIITDEGNDALAHIHGGHREEVTM